LSRDGERIHAFTSTFQTAVEKYFDRISALYRLDFREDTTQVFALVRLEHDADDDKLDESSVRTKVQAPVSSAYPFGDIHSPFQLHPYFLTLINAICPWQPYAR
jgi:hypothetical protein